MPDTRAALAMLASAGGEQQKGVLPAGMLSFEGCSPVELLRRCIQSPRRGEFEELLGRPVTPRWGW